MTRLVAYAASLFITFTLVGNYWGAHWTGKWASLMWVWATCFSLLIAKRTSLVYLPLILISLCSGVYMSFWILGPYHTPQTDKIVALALERNSTGTLVVFIAACITVAYLPRRLMPIITECLMVLLGISVVSTLCGSVLVPDRWVIFNPIHTIPYERGGVSGNASMNACLMGCLAPFVTLLPNNRLVVWILTLIALAIATTKSSVGMLVLVATFMAYQLSKRGLPSRNKLILFSCVSASMLIAIGVASGMDVFTGNGRYRIWGLLTDWAWNNDKVLWGSGLGTVRVLLPLIQATKNAIGGEFFMWAHNDFLQTGIELGVIGSLALLVAWFATALMAYSRPVLFASLIGWSVCGFFNYPLRLPLHAACITLLVWMIVSKRGGELNGN